MREASTSWKHFRGKTGIVIYMLKIPFSGNSKVIDLLQVTKVEKHIPKRIMSAANLKGSPLHPGQTLQKMHCVLQVDEDK